MEKREILILGGGPIGLLIGNLLLDKGIETSIYEEDTTIGRSQHCTGIVSLSTLNLYPVPRERIIANKLYGVKITINNLLEEEFHSSTAKAVVLDRELLEVSLAERYQSRGGRLILGKKMNIDSLRKRGKLVINAGGTKELLKSGYKGLLPALQLDIRLEKDLFDERITMINVDKTLNPHYFSWLTPVNTEGIIRVGTAANTDPENKLKELIREKLSKKDVNIIKRLGGQIIVGGPREKFMDNNIIFVGDSAGMVKVSTGGGLNYGGVGAHILAMVLYEEIYDEYRNLWVKRFKREIQLQRLLREIFLKLEDKKIAEIFSILSKKEVLNQLFLMGNMDYHATDLYKILLEKDFIKILLKEKMLSKFIKHLFTKI